MPKLTVTLPEAEEVTHDLTAPVITIGRLDDNALQIEDPSVSSRHAQLTLQPDGNYQLRDLNSTNGTRVNGNGVTEAQLHPGDRLRFGKVETVYLSDVPGENVPAPTGANAAHAGAADMVATLPAAGVATAQVAAESHRPADFANASPFQKKPKARDPVGRAILIFAAVAFVLFLAALFFIFSLRPPANLPV